MSTERERRTTPFDALLKPFGDVRGGEGARVITLLISLFLLLVSYYVIKTVREPLILASGHPELKSYGAAGQALVLMAFVPAYSWLSSRVSRTVLIPTVTAIFVACLQVFYFGAQGVLGADPPAETELSVGHFTSIGYIFYVWVGIFSVAMIAQFWAMANDLYPRATGERLFPIIAVGAPAGSWAGSVLAEWLFDHDVTVPMMFQVTSVLLVVHALLAWFVMRRASTADHVDGQGAEAPIDSPNGFLLVFRSPYLRLIALLLVLLNVVNTTGEQILSTSVYERAVALADAGEIDDVGAWIGAFYGDFFGWVNLATVLVQALLVSRIVKLFGIRGVVFALPIVALGVYGSLALGAGFAAFRIAKMAENTTDYSVMNTAKAMLWLPTSRAEKYKAKQAVDTFFVRFGDLIAAGFVFVAAELLSLGLRSFAVFNLVMIAAWFGVAVLVVRRYRALADSDAQASDQA